MSKNRFSTVSDYIVNASDKKGLAAVPDGVAAEFLGVALSGISDMLRKGTLQSVTIEGGRSKWRGVLTTSLLEVAQTQEKERKGWISQVKESLIEAARKGETVEYGALTQMLGVNSTPQNRAKVAMILDDAARESFEENGYLLSAFAILKGRGRPNEKFFALARDLKIFKSGDDPKLFWEEQMSIGRKALEKKAADDGGKSGKGKKKKKKGKKEK